MNDITTLRSMLNSRVLEIREILARKRKNRGRFLALESNKVGRGRFVSVCWTPEI